ncbi:MAG TPA: hypothetical protein VHF07_08985, partial [Nitrospiraceae bacterium]|nr:hypothetical protein [Nitrospiraceae bacterium]
EQVDLNERGTVDLVLQLLVRYRNMVKQDSELSISKRGIVVGQTQIEIAGGSADSPILQAGGTIQAVEPKDIGEILNELQPVLAAVKQTLLRVDTITQDVQGAVKAGGRALEQVAAVTEELPALVASVQRTATSVERTVESLPDMTESVKRTLGVMDRVTADVQQATRRLPAIIDSTQDVLQSVKTLSTSVNEMSQELTPVVRTAQTTLADISLLVRGAKQTFPFSRFVQNAGPSSGGAEGAGLKSLRADIPPLGR